MIPDLITQPNSPWKILPPGIHVASLSDVEATFAYNTKRRQLYLGLMDASHSLYSAGCKTVYIDGSFVTGKPIPGDFDACWDPTGVDVNKLDPVFLDFADGRRNQKLRFMGELFPFNAYAEPGRIFLDFFQVEKHSGGKKGVVAIDLTKESFNSSKGGVL